MQEVINFTRGVPAVEAFPTEDLIACGEAALRRDPHILLQYGRSPGYAPLRQWLSERYGVAADQVLVGNSSLEIMSFIAQTQMRPGARVFVENPTYDRALLLLRRTGAQVVGLPLEADGLSLAALEDALSRGAPALLYLIADFQNPAGVTTSLAKRERLAELAEKHGFWIVEDAPYRDLRYLGHDVPTLLSLAPGRVLHMSSFSKVLAPGLRLGYLVGPAPVVAELAAWAVDTYIGPVYPTQGMVYEYCQRGLLEPNLARLKELYRPRLEATLAALAKHLPQATWTRPEGGFFIGVTLPAGCDCADLTARAKAVGLVLADGGGFFTDPAAGRRFVRIPFCSVKPEAIEEGVARLARLLQV